MFIKNICFSIIFFLSVALTSGAMLLERNEGLLERSLVVGKIHILNKNYQPMWFDAKLILLIINLINIAGVTGPEILFGQVVTQFCVMFGQTIMVLIVAFAVFKVTCHGDIVYVTLLTVLSGFCGMCFGKYSLFSIVHSFNYIFTITIIFLIYKQTSQKLIN